MLCKIFRKPHSTAGKFAPKNHLFYQSLFICFPCTGKTHYLCKSSAKNKEQNQTSYRLSFKLLVVNQSNMLHRINDID